ncbi:ATP-binding cassette domain-containing protein [Prosthecomicrobium pneumaticum]|uniref:Ribose transport system ATP-binding protein n=1 Tax=Prosthecomicrobium pneumaticum TaxID=81895 RepID=A0A7W9CTN1_9HYPH|nr:ATP-binding cassette domain-containing protein [Prosthecomicrobium pneumaticum]MBB5751326.1 ribose transport system ATP-binding protein [Prosthecomicrobium pneumaticum]
MPETVLKIERVSKTYPGVRALDTVSLDCRAGEVHAILGENGSGKSTLMKIASGAITPDGGTVEIGGVRLEAADPRAAHALGLATVYQDDSLVRELTVAQNLYLGTRPGSVPFRAMESWAAAQLAPYGVAISVRTLVGDLTPAQRQFVEIVKALIAGPRVLLLDEPTSTLDIDGVRQLAGIVRDLTARGTGVIYVSHRLPEILDLADRVSILRDGVHQGTFDVTPDLSEHDLVARMIGRDVEGEFPPKPERLPDEPVLAVEDLTGQAFRSVSFTARRGEILGFAGAEGNGQREALRAIVGLEEASGAVRCAGRPVDTASPDAALAGGIAFLSADRPGEGVFPELAVQKNMVLTQLGRFLSHGFLSAGRERTVADRMKTDFTVVAASLDVPVAGLSGGNQQKAVLARSFRSGARVVLIDEPTQGVDAGARYEIYKAIRENIREDGACIVNSSDAQELEGICDRVLVFSRGQIVRELVGPDVTEENIVGAFLTSRHGKAAAGPADEAGPIQRLFGVLANGSAVWWVPLVFLALLTLLVGTWAATQSPVFLKPINIRHMLLAAAPAGLVAMAQLMVLLVRGLDVSVGSLMSLTVVAASFILAGGGPGLLFAGAAGCLLLGLLVGLANGSLVRFAGINPVITTIAMLSVLQGVALVLRPIPGGLIDPGFAELLRTRIGFLPVSTLFLLVLAIAGDLWLNRSRAGLETKAVGFREEAARRNGVRVDRVQLRAYALAGGMAALAGLFLGSEVGVGHPTVAQNYALTSIAAAVLGGAALSGGRGSFAGALFGAVFFTLMINVISILGLSSSVGVIASGAMTLLAIFLYSGLKEFEQLLRGLRRRKSPAALAAAE